MENEIRNISPEILVSLGLKDVAKLLDERLTNIAGKRMPFLLVVMGTTNKADTNYISNCNRKDTIKAIEHLVNRLKKGMENVPAHKKH